MTNTRKKTNANAVGLFWSLAADLMSQHASVVEGTIMNGRCLRVGSEFLALADSARSLCSMPSRAADHYAKRPRFAPT